MNNWIIVWRNISWNWLHVLWSSRLQLIKCKSINSVVGLILSVNALEIAIIFKFHTFPGKKNSAFAHRFVYRVALGDYYGLQFYGRLPLHCILDILLSVLLGCIEVVWMLRHISGTGSPNNTLLVMGSSFGFELRCRVDTRQFIDLFECDLPLPLYESRMNSKQMNADNVTVLRIAAVQRRRVSNVSIFFAAL